MVSSSLVSSTGPPDDGDLTIRTLVPCDRQDLLRILEETRAFTADEVKVATELIDIGQEDTPDGYRFLVMERAGRIVGYSCYGHIPCTDAVYDLYWIAVDHSLQGLGLGRALLQATERAIHAEGGRMVLIETASKEEYGATRGFYLGNGYWETARVCDFYRVGDDKVIYRKDL